MRESGVSTAMRASSLRIEGESDRAIGGTAWDGMKAVFASRYMTGIALFIFLMTFVSTMLYFQQADVFAEAFADRGERRAFYAKVDVAVNILTIIFQVYLTARIVQWLGVGITLAAVPLLMAAGFFGLGLWPTLWVLVAVLAALTPHRTTTDPGPAR